jgi:small subunit ribosomal protein S16
LGVGAQPSDKVKVLIRKYGSKGTHREAQQAALQRLQVKRSAPPPLASVPIPKKEKPHAGEVAVESAQEASE